MNRGPLGPTKVDYSPPSCGILLFSGHKRRDMNKERRVIKWAIESPMF